MVKYKLIIITFLVLSLTSCYTRKQAVRKFCSTKSYDTTITVLDTFYTPSIDVDTIFSTKIDSIILVKDNLVIRYKKILDKVYLEGTVTVDTFYKEKLITVQVNTPCPDPDRVTFVDKLRSFLALLSLVLIALLLFILKSRS